MADTFQNLKDLPYNGIMENEIGKKYGMLTVIA